MKKKKTWIIIGVVAVLAIFGYFAMTSDNSRSTKVKTDTVEREDLTEKVSASGRIQPQTKVDITSEINGEIITLAVVEGQPVALGDLLVVLDTVQIKADVDQARYSLDGALAALEGSKARADEAREEFERQEYLFGTGGSAETVFLAAKYANLNAKAALDGARAQANVAEAGYDKQMDRLSKAKIAAPMDGIITFLDCEVGEIAAAQTSFTQGRTLMTISDLRVFEVEVEVDETEINKIELGQITEIEVDAIPDTTFPGTVVEIGNTAIMVGMGTQDQSTNFRVKVQFADANVKLRPGMSATVDITSAEHTNVLSVPFASVVVRNYDLDSLEAARAGETSNDSGSGDVLAAEGDEEDPAQDSVSSKKDDEREDIKGVFVMRDGKAFFVPIGTGIAGQKNIEVTSGLEESDTVISGPYSVLRNIKDGDEVELLPEGDGEES